MKKFLLISVIFNFFLFSCGNDVTTGGNDSDEIEVADSIDKEITDEDSNKTDDQTSDETQDEVTDEVQDEATDEVSDNDNADECKNMDVELDWNNLDAVAENITLSIYSNGWGTLLDNLLMETEGSIKIEVDEENPYDGETPSYFIYETAEGFFTDIKYAAYGDTVNVDLDPIMPGHVNGIIFIVQTYFGPTELSNTAIEVKDEDGKTVGCFSTEEKGRFIIDIPNGNYVFHFEDMDGMIYAEPVKIDSNYVELRVPAQAMDAKPNIYLYPEKTIELDVTIGFPIGGFITTSIPQYGDGWHVTVDPDGTIDGEYTFLFYESQNPDVFQYSKGWTVKNKDLEKFFRYNMALYGFQGQEINDFIDWWIPRFDGSCYDIFPQTAKEINPVVTLNFSIEPDSLQRLYYTVKEYKKCNEHLEKPVIEPFERKGFSALEWGVTLR